MSVQFGRWNFDGEAIDREYLEKVRPLLAPYGPDDASSYSKNNISILYHALHTTKESRRETQPHVLPSGAVLTWDGRLDNRAELIRDLRDVLSIGCSDTEIVAAAYGEWRTNCFAKVIGDWALSIWEPHDRSLILAKDPIGTRHLYYSFDDDRVTWSTILDPLVLFAGKTFALNEEYIAGWFSFFPAAHLTPYIGIHSVPPSSFVLVRPGKRTVSKYWDFDPGKKIRYRSDAEYEEHFRTVFAEAVRRRLRSDTPILAELSGGRDSSCIVCMADILIARGEAEIPRLDTISFYDDSEPNWDDRPYFTKVEEKRGRTGWHINFGLQDAKENPRPEPSKSLSYHSVPIPEYGGRTSQQIALCLDSRGYRVVLSGTGGDEVMGGVPLPTPELQDLLARAQFRTLVHQLKAWALEKRKPWFHLFFDAARGFFPPSLVGVPKNMRPAPWLQSNFVKHHWATLTGYPSRVKVFGPLPSFQDDVSTLDVLRRRLGCKAMQSQPLFEKWYPYMDRGLLEFMYATPREQSVRPTQRRSLMRRALIDIVPAEILNRKRKAFVARAPLVAIARDWANMVEMTHHMVSGSLGIVDQERFSDVLQRARRGGEVPTVTLMRTIYIEGWLRKLRGSGVVNLDTAAKPQLAWQASIQG